MKQLTFTKMHGIGNDFVMVDFLAAKPDVTPEELQAASAMLCDRKFGVGADGVVLVLPGEMGSADFAMRMFNPDASEAEMCGNAIRCLGKMVHDRGYMDNAGITVETMGGLKTLTLHAENGAVSEVSVNMGKPGITRADIGMEGTATDTVIGDGLTIGGEETIVVTGVSIGNPHLVYFDPATDESINRLGSVLENHPLFPRRVNVHVAEVVAPDEIKMLTWERGVGRTLACGTGACAVAVAANLNGLTGRQVLVHLAGGDLRIDWQEDTEDVLMTGGATEVFTATIALP